jgi:hypothetical protein
MSIFSWRRRAVVYLTNLVVIGTGALLGYGIDTFLIKDGRHLGVIGGTLLSFPVAMVLTVYFVRASFKKTPVKL